MWNNFLQNYYWLFNQYRDVRVCTSLSLSLSLSLCVRACARVCVRVSRRFQLSFSHIVMATAWCMGCDWVRVLSAANTDTHKTRTLLSHTILTSGQPVLVLSSLRQDMTESDVIHHSQTRARAHTHTCAHARARTGHINDDTLGNAIQCQGHLQRWSRTVAVTNAWQC